MGHLPLRILHRVGLNPFGGNVKNAGMSGKQRFDGELKKIKGAHSAPMRKIRDRCILNFKCNADPADIPSRELHPFSSLFVVTKYYSRTGMDKKGERLPSEKEFTH